MSSIAQSCVMASIMVGLSLSSGAADWNGTLPFQQLEPGEFHTLLHLGEAKNVNPPTSLGNLGVDLLAGYGTETKMMPKPGDVCRLGDRDYPWTVVTDTDGRWSDNVGEYYIAYYHVYLYVEGTARRNVTWTFAHDDGMMAWNNGRAFHVDTGYVGDNHAVSDYLEPGLNSITFKLEEGNGGDFIYMHLADAEGKNLEGVSWSTSPGFSVAAPGTGYTAFTRRHAVEVRSFPVVDGAVAWQITTSATAPAADDANWQTYTAGLVPSGEFTYESEPVDNQLCYYAWFKDENGTVTGYLDAIALDESPPSVTLPESVTLVRPKATGMRTILVGELGATISSASGVFSTTVSPAMLPAEGGTVTLYVTNNVGNGASATTTVNFIDGFGPLPQGWITKLLHLGINFDTDDPANGGSDDDPLAAFGGHANLNPYHGLKFAPVATSGSCTTPGELTWVAMSRDREDGRWQPYNNDSRDYYNKYWHIYVISPDEEERDINFIHCNDDGLRIWVNGTLQVSHGGAGGPYTTPGKLSPGLNSITIKLNEGGGGDYMSIAIRKPDGTYFDDLTYSLDPPDSFFLACAETGSAASTGSGTVSVAKFPLANGKDRCQITFSDDPASIDENAWVEYVYGSIPESLATVTFPDSVLTDGAELVCYAWFKKDGDASEPQVFASTPIVYSTDAPTVTLHTAIFDAFTSDGHTVDLEELIEELNPGESGFYRAWTDPAVVHEDCTVTVYVQNNAGLTSSESIPVTINKFNACTIVPDEFFATFAGTVGVQSDQTPCVVLRYAAEGASVTNTVELICSMVEDDMATYETVFENLTDGTRYFWWGESYEGSLLTGTGAGEFTTDKIVYYGDSGTIGATASSIGDDILLTYAGDGKIEFKRPATVDVLLVGGGGGGGTWIGGGGGGGGVVYRQSVTVEPGKYLVKVGRGGTGANWDGTIPSANGGDSSVFGLVAIGGGAGGGSSYTDNIYDGRNNGLDGGSGGGGSGHIWWNPDTYVSGAGTVEQGYAGGVSKDGAGAGGGGAGGVGGDAGDIGGVGGPGRVCAITGVDVIYGGGGAGGCGTYGGGDKSARGGEGGGGNGGWLNSGTNGAMPGTDGTDGLGGGGGAGGVAFQYNNQSGYGGGNGGSGVVIIRFTQHFAVDSKLGTGGNEIIKTDDGQMVHIFRTSGTFELPNSARVDVFMVGGGGAGGSGYLCGGGGGGAGGVIKRIGFKLLAGRHEVVIGAGGSAEGQASGSAGNGQSTTFFGLEAKGGGGGGSLYSGHDGFPNGTGADGASGGGAAGGGHNYCNNQSRGGLCVEGQGFVGGANVYDNPPVDGLQYVGAGGGGAGEAGFAPGLVPGAVSDYSAGYGGKGVMIDWTGEEVWYAGGGGGGNHDWYQASVGLGGLGGGGNGGLVWSTEAQSGVDGTGGGGGGGYMDNGNRGKDGGNGGSGIVIIRYKLRPAGFILFFR